MFCKNGTGVEFYFKKTIVIFYITEVEKEGECR